jgi:hypothetical protein
VEEREGKGLSLKDKGTHEFPISFYISHGYLITIERLKTKGSGAEKAICVRGEPRLSIVHREVREREVK